MEWAASVWIVVVVMGQVGRQYVDSDGADKQCVDSDGAGSESIVMGKAVSGW